MASVTPKKRPLAAARLCTEEAGDVRSPKRPSLESFTYSDGGANSDDETSLLFSLETEPTLGPLTDDMQDLAIRDDDGVERKIYDPRVVIEKKEVGDELQQKAIKLALDGENIFLTGKAGTGKSWTTKQLVKSFHEKSEVIHVTAPTGIAAININGVTIHSWGQFRLGEYYGDFDMMMEKKCRKKIKSSNALLIDEISMLDGQLFDVLECMVAIIRCYDLVEKRLKLIKEEPGSGNTIMSPLMLKLRWDTTSELGLCDIPPWGGLQIIVVGDFFQLPPIPKGHDVLIASNELMETDSHLKIGRQGSYAFESHAWHHSNFVTVELVQVHRQASSDVGLFEFLNAMREGEPDLASKHTATISALKAPLVERDDGIVPTELHSKNANVDAINQRELAKLRSTSHEFESLDEVVFCNEYKAKVLKKFGLDHISHMPYLFASVEKVPSPTPLVEARVKLKGIEGKMAQLIKIEDFEALMPLKKEKNSLKDSIELMEREEEQKQTINASSFGAFATGIDPRVTFDRYTCFKAHLIADHAVLAQHFRDNFFAKECRVSEEIEMKEGAQVMLLWNLDVKAGLANGSRGVLKAFWPTAGYYHLLRKELKSRNKNEGQNHAKRYEEYPAEEEAKCAMAKFEQCSKEEEARSAIVGGSNAGCSSNVSADITLMKGREENTPGDSSSEYDFSSFDEDHLNEITSHIGGMHVDFLQREIQEIGKIINLTHDLPYVRFTNGKERLIKPQPFSREIKNCGNASRWQIPLTLAWAISIHKSQGMTIEWLKINMKDCFAVGQAYVACSRGKSLGSMQVDHFNSFEVKTSDKVKKFYNSLNGGEPYTETWSDTIEIFDNDVQNKIEEQREVAEHYKDTFCKLCKTQCTVRQTMTNKNGNKGRWFITCPAGNSSEGHTFSFVVASPRKQNPYTSRISYLIPKPGINGAIRDKLKGKRFVSTGVFPQLGGGEGLTVGKEKLKEMIVSFGGVVTGSISGKTDYLIRGEDPGQVKLDQAQSRGVTALDLDDIRKILLGHSAFPPTQTDPMSHSMKSFFGNNHEIQQHS